MIRALPCPVGGRCFGYVALVEAAYFINPAFAALMIFALAGS